MAVLDTNEIFLHAVLTRRGREILFKQNEKFLITKFALSDDGVNYSLVSDADPDGGNIVSLAIFGPSTNDNNAMNSKLIRSSEELQYIAQENQYKFVPSTEITVETSIVGNTTLSLQNWNSDTCVVSFALVHPVDHSFFLSESFIIDASSFFSNYGILPNTGIAFDYLLTQPFGVLGQPNIYWYNASSSYLDENGKVIPVVLGIDSAHRPINGLPLSETVNTLGISIVTFSIKLKESQLRGIFTYMLNRNLTSITDTIIIHNNDNTVNPLTDFYGPNSNYTNLATKIPITITF